MKKRNLLSGLFWAALMSLGLTGIQQTAQAQSGGDWTCDNGANPVPNGYDGSVDIQYNPFGTDPTNCVLGNKHVTGSFGVSGYASYSIGGITADNGSVIIRESVPITAGNITAGTIVEIGSSTTGLVNVGKVTAGTTGTGRVTLSSGGNLSTGTVKNTNGYIALFTLQGTIKSGAITNTNGNVYRANLSTGRR